MNARLQRRHAKESQWAEDETVPGIRKAAEPRRAPEKIEPAYFNCQLSTHVRSSIASLSAPPSPRKRWDSVCIDAFESCSNFTNGTGVGSLGHPRWPLSRSFDGTSCLAPPRERPAIWGFMPIWQWPGRHRRSGQTDAQPQCRAFRCRPHYELGAADRRLFATITSAGTCSCAG
jgi:hypothetical protein